MGDRVHKALLIANWDFPRDPGQLPALNGPRADVRHLQEVLTSQRTGLYHPDHVQVLSNRTRGGMLRRIEDFFLDATRDDQLLLYYSGHGKLSLFDELFLCAKDTRVDRLVSTAVSTSAVSTVVDASPAAAKILILDCCYAGSFKGSAGPGKLAGEGRFVLTASRGAELAPDADAADTTSPFTRFLVEALDAKAEDSDGDGYLSVDDVYTYVADRMREERLSRPQRSFAAAVDVIALARTPAGARPLPPVAINPPKRAVPLLSPADAREEVQRGREAERNGQLRAAREAYERAARGNAGDWSVLAADLLGPLLEAGDDIPGATAAYQQVAASGHPDWAPRAAVRVAHHLEAKGREAACRLAIASGHPEWAPAAASLLADDLTAQGNTRAARELYDQAIHSGHSEWAARALVMVGTLLAGEGEVAAAKAAYRRAVLSGNDRWAGEAAARLNDIAM
ncbi:caspase, EACC1-associated type [Actinocrispum wychmicini]|uniref:Caspase domain-containing protein n=1 Tax=Actinocrispum wychmicini TaxID=1213861 RepID=A0A4V2S7M9_9PSEU|nr:caspase family protein [Actinocrispum wychmicini]TCO60610.1 caspase domain-containing protein [Actinocrispum wychmicini]